MCLVVCRTAGALAGTASAQWSVVMFRVTYVLSIVESYKTFTQARRELTTPDQIAAGSPFQIRRVAPLRRVAPKVHSEPSPAPVKRYSSFFFLLFDKDT